MGKARFWRLHSIEVPCRANSLPCICNRRKAPGPTTAPAFFPGPSWAEPPSGGCIGRGWRDFGQRPAAQPWRVRTRPSRAEVRARPTLTEGWRPQAEGGVDKGGCFAFGLMFVNKYLMAMRFADILAQLLKILEVAAGRDGGQGDRVQGEGVLHREQPRVRNLVRPP